MRAGRRVPPSIKATYGTAENVTAIERAHIRAYFPLTELGHRSSRFRDPEFAYDSTTDACRCPGDETLRFLPECSRTHRRIDLAPPSACMAKELRAQCTTSPRGRRISRSLEESYLDRVRDYHETDPYAKAVRRCKVRVEPLFAEAKDCHGLRPFPLRRLELFNGAALLIATGQNLKRLLSKQGGGQRPRPSGATGVVLPAALPTVDAQRSSQHPPSSGRPAKLHAATVSAFVNTQGRF